MTDTVTFIGARGGQGTSTVAAALALGLANDVPTTLATHDPTGMARLLGGQPPTTDGPFVAAPNLTVTGLGGPTDGLTVVDAGSIVAADDRLLLDGRCYGVVRGPCYLALATLVPKQELRLDGIVLLAEPGRALSAADASMILGLPVVATVPVRASTARLIDAGLLAGRPNEVSGLEHLRDAVLSARAVATAGPTTRPRCASLAFARTAADHHPDCSWGHEL
ncbi:MAG TPA: hypothetical protein VHL53_12870 [Acidimicrobiia bacterium]|nr:hypothetical protein [Acidimicrobiia bacterium]